MPQFLKFSRESGPRLRTLLALAAIVPLPGLAAGATFIWDNSTGSGLWSAAENWGDDEEPDAAGEVWFPAGLPGTITLDTGESAAIVRFAAPCNLSGGSLSLPAGNYFHVDAGVTATLATSVAYTAGLGKSGPGILVLAPGAYSNPASIGDLLVSEGSVAISSDAALGPAANGVHLLYPGANLHIEESFATARTITATTQGSHISVAAGKEFILNGSLSGSGLTKSGPGIMTFPPAADNRARGTATTVVSDGILRIQGPNNVSGGGWLQVGNAAAGSGTGSVGLAALLRDADTTFTDPVEGQGGTIHVDRAPGGTGIDGRHTIATLALADNSIRITGDHGYGLSLGQLMVSKNSTITNAAPAPLLIGAVSRSFNGDLTVRGPGETHITGPLSNNPGVTSFGLQVREGASLRLGSAVPPLINGLVVLNDTVLDTNNLSPTVSRLTFSGYGDPDLLGESPSDPVHGPRLELGTGVLNLSGHIYANNPHTTALIHGAVNLGSYPRSITVGPHSTAGNLVIDGPISGIGTDANLTKGGSGLLTLLGAGNTFPGRFTIEGGEVRLGKSQGLGSGPGGMAVFNGTYGLRSGVSLLVDEQIHDSAAFSLAGAGKTWPPTPVADIFLDVGNHRETIGPMSLRYEGGDGAAAVKIGPQGQLILNGNVSFTNNSNGGSRIPANLLITGNGTLDLGGTVRTVSVSGTNFGLFKDQANATIDARVVNGGIIKTGAKTLFLTHPANSIAGGIEVREGFVGPGMGGLAGLGEVTFSNASGVLAGYDFGAVQGTVPGDLVIAGANDFELRYSGSYEQPAVLGGSLTLEKNLAVNVTTGYFSGELEGGLELSGLITDGSGNFGLTKKGAGILKLGPENAFGGPTLLDEGTLWITGPGSLGDGNGPLLIDGGCLMAADSFTLPRAVTFTASGGKLRSDGLPGMEFSGPIDWGSGTSGAFGRGTTILSGSSSGSGNFLLGTPDSHASDYYYWKDGGSACISLRGTAALPAGNLSFDRHAVLELGNGDFTRPLGAGPGTFRIPTASQGGGWAAYGAERYVNVGGAGEVLVWGGTNPFFAAPSLVLGSRSATHTLNFVNPLRLVSLAPYNERNIVSHDGPAVIDARLSGDLTIESSPADRMALMFWGEGTLEIIGALRGEFSFQHYDGGTIIFRGANEAAEMILYRGKWVFANPASLGAPRHFSIGGHVDVSALPGGLAIDPEGELEIYGSITGDVTAPDRLSGAGGMISGDLTAGASTALMPSTYGALKVGGDFDFVAGAWMGWELPERLYGGTNFPALEVAGSVSLDGHLHLDGFGDGLAVGDRIVLLTNAGSDPIQGNFEDLPEGTVIPASGNHGLRISYTANADAGPIGNDVVIEVISLQSSGDKRLLASAPLAAAPGEVIEIRYTVAGPAVPGGGQGVQLHVQLPGNVSFLDSTPPGHLTASTLTLDLQDLVTGSTGTAVVRVAAAAVGPAVVRIAATASGSQPGLPAPAVETRTAILPGGRLSGPSAAFHPNNPAEFQLGLQSLEGVRYVSEVSVDLQAWYRLAAHEGTGGPLHLPLPVDRELMPSGFYRLRIIPHSAVQQSGAAGAGTGGSPNH